MQADDASPCPCYRLVEFSWHLAVRLGGRIPGAGLEAFESLVPYLHRDQIA